MHFQNYAITNNCYFNLIIVTGLNFVTKIRVTIYSLSILNYSSGINRLNIVDSKNKHTTTCITDCWNLYTMANLIALAVLVSLGIVLVDGECQTNGGPIDNCCCLGYNNNNYNVKSSGVYTIGNFCGVKCSNARVYCDTTSGGGGWTIIQRRQDGGGVEFEARDWVEYEDGFGDLNGEFWLGLRSMNCLTSTGTWELRIDYQLQNGTKSYLHYKQFAVRTNIN